jgi:hypothetical protein
MLIGARFIGRFVLDIGPNIPPSPKISFIPQISTERHEIVNAANFQIQKKN